MAYKERIFMKSIALMIITISLFASCKKCYKCTTSITSQSSSAHKEIVREYEFCTTKKSDIYNEERRGTGLGSGGGTEQVTTCER